MTITLGCCSVHRLGFVRILRPCRHTVTRKQIARCNKCQANTKLVYRQSVGVANVRLRAPLGEAAATSINIAPMKIDPKSIVNERSNKENCRATKKKIGKMKEMSRATRKTFPFAG